MFTNNTQIHHLNGWFALMTFSAALFLIYTISAVSGAPGGC